jgi:hypothetical protein
MTTYFVFDYCSDTDIVCNGESSETEIAIVDKTDCYFGELKDIAHRLVGSGIVEVMSD